MYNGVLHLKHYVYLSSRNKIQFTYRICNGMNDSRKSHGVIQFFLIKQNKKQNHSCTTDLPYPRVLHFGVQSGWKLSPKICILLNLHRYFSWHCSVTQLLPNTASVLVRYSRWPRGDSKARRQYTQDCILILWHFLQIVGSTAIPESVTCRDGGVTISECTKHRFTSS